MNAPATVTALPVPRLEDDPGLRVDHVIPAPVPVEYLELDVDHLAERTAWVAAAFKAGVDPGALLKALAHIRSHACWVLDQYTRHTELLTQTTRGVLAGMDHTPPAGADLAQIVPASGTHADTAEAGAQTQDDGGAV